MRSDAKASTAGSSKRQARGLGHIFRGALATRGSSGRGPGRRAPSAGRRLAIPTAVLAAIVAVLVALVGLADAATSAITEPATNVGGTHATLNGIVNPEGVEPEECFFEWTQNSNFGPPPSYENTVPCAETPAEIGSGASPVAVHADITGLEPQNTRYHFRLVVVDPSETHYGADKRIQTLYTVVTEAPSSNTGTRATLAGVVNPEGVELSECFFKWGEGADNTPYTDTVPCAETPAEIGTGTSPVAVHADIGGLIPQGVQNSDPYHYRLVAVNPGATIEGSNQNFKTPNTVTAEAATGVTPTEVTLNGSVNPDTATISECAFEWGLPKEPGEEIQQYPEAAPCVPGPGGITGESPVAVHADLSGLHAGTTYAYRLEATYPTGQVQSTALTAQTAGPVIAAAWTQGVTLTEATLEAQVNPEGKATTYRFEYGPTEAYGQETEELPVGSDSSVHRLARFLEGLQPGATYHYRAIATNADAENVGPDLTFTTYRPFVADTGCPNQVYRSGPAALLPDCRAYEMVSPVDKEGGDIHYLATNGGVPVHNQSSLDGDKLTYTSASPFAESEGHSYVNQYMATRAAGGWSTEPLTPPGKGGPPDGAAGIDRDYRAFTPDLSYGFLIPESDERPLAPGALAGNKNLYRRDISSGAYETLSVGQDGGGSIGDVFLQGITADGNRAVFRAHAALTPDAPPVPGESGNHANLYEWVEGELRLVSILPNGEPLANGNPTVGTMPFQQTAGTHVIGGFREKLQHAISTDGSRIVWTALPTGIGGGNGGEIYMRIDGERTVAVSGSVPDPGRATYVTASADGSKVFFLAGSGPTTFPALRSMYEFDVATETSTVVAPEVLGAAVGASDDASYLYFASLADLDAGAVAGGNNLYLYHGGALRFIATLPAEDASAFSQNEPGAVSEFNNHRATRVTPDGKTVVFLSHRSLTGYDNVDPVSGESLGEVYRYDAVAGKLTCVSCNPSGARPAAWGNLPFGPLGGSATKFAAWIPPFEESLYGARVLSEDGKRVFFNSYDALVPQDANGVQDVYEWEAPGSGGCSEASRAFSDLNGGCVSLISSGESAKPSEFSEASPNGDDAFIRTASSFAPQDPGSFDLYDARVGGGFPPPPEPSVCSGDSCQSPAEAPRAATLASAGFRGAGNLRATRNCAAPARRAARLSRRAKALRGKVRRAHSPKRARTLRRRSARLVGKAKQLRKSSRRCRRAERRAGR